jgi:hypothetical protein
MQPRLWPQYPQRFHKRLNSALYRTPQPRLPLRILQRLHSSLLRSLYVPRAEPRAQRLGEHEEEEKDVDGGADSGGVEYEGRHVCAAQDQRGNFGAECEADVEYTGEARKYVCPGVQSQGNELRNRWGGLPGSVRRTVGYVSALQLLDKVIEVKPRRLTLAWPPAM